MAAIPNFQGLDANAAASVTNDFASAAVSTGNADAVSAVATTRKKSDLLQDDGSIKQTERLLTARARYGATNLLTGTSGDLGGSRGQWSYIKLMTSKAQADAYGAGDNSRGLSYPGDLLPTLAKFSDPAGTNTNGYDRFLLTSVSCQLSEKTQITEVFGDNEVIYYFGRQPMIFNISGILIDSPDNNWFVDWLKFYTEIFRGSQLAKNYELLKIVLPNMVLTGTMSSMTWNQDSQRDVDIPFSFQFIAKHIEPIAATATGMATSPNLKYVDFSKASNFVGQDAINGLKGQVANLQGVIQNPASSLAQKAAALTSLGSSTGSALDHTLGTLSGTLSGFQSTVQGWDKARAGFFNSIQSSSLFQTVTSSLTGIRLNLFSPVYGIMSSLSKLVTNTANSAINLLSKVITPVRNILRDITNIAHQAVSLVNLVSSSITGIGRSITGALKGVSSDFQTAIHSLGKAAGAIATAPVTTAQAVASMFNNSTLTSSASFLGSPAKLTFTRPAGLPGGTPPAPPPKAVLLRTIATYDPAVARL